MQSIGFFIDSKEYKLSLKYSPDLNPIENIWAWLKNKVSHDNPINMQQLKKSVRKHWKQINSEFCSKYINSWSNRCQLGQSYPDLSPIENVWAVIKDQLYVFKDQIKNSDDLFNSACEIFYNFDIIQQTIRNSYNSMKKRIEQVYIQEGDNI
ncbi:hypothetical protein ABPG72_018372 [Tetrahymena utriculariae]